MATCMDSLQIEPNPGGTSVIMSSVEVKSGHVDADWNGSARRQRPPRSPLIRLKSDR
jgi:hypothetical protein